MKATKFALVIVVFFLIGATGISQVGDSEYDNRIKKQLDRLGLDYTITDNGNFKLILDTEGGRTQLVYVKSKTYTYKDMEIREVTAPASVEDDKYDFSRNTLFDLLELNQTYKIGSWQIHGGSSPYILEFCVKADAEVSNTRLHEFIKLAAKMADEVEEDITGEDKY